GAGNKNVSNSISLYDHHFSYSLQIKEELEKQFKVDVSWLPFAYEEGQENKTKVYKKRICFIGNPDENRARYINLLLENKIPVTLYGNHWHKFVDINSDFLE